MSADSNGIPLTMHFDDPEPISIDVTIKDKLYKLKEPTADIAARYRSANARCARFDDGKMKSVDGVGDTDPYLVSMCLFEMATDGTLKSVPIPTIRSWKQSIVRDLADKLKEIGMLNDEKDTVDTLKKKIGSLEAKLEVLRGGSAEADGDMDPVGNSSSGTRASSS